MKAINKKLLVLFFFLLNVHCLLAQDTANSVEPDMETSFENTELMIVALIGLALLLALYFFFRRRRKQ